MQKAIIYCRVSSERQKTEGHGLESQEQRCREYAKQKGYEVEIVFGDSFTGGGDYTKRPAMSELMAYMDAKPYNSYIVIFDDLKRLARDTEQYIKLKKALEIRRASVECPNFVFSKSPEGQYIETIMAATAQLEREQNRRQVLQKMKARLELGYWTFSEVPPGYLYKNDPLHGKFAFIDTVKKGPIVKEALEGFASGRFINQEDVRRFLQEKDIQNGKPIYLDYVKRMLTRVFYAGYVEYTEWEVDRRKAKHEALISLATYEAIQDKLNGKKTTHIKNYINEDFPLRNFVHCSTCNQPLTASWSTGRKGKYPYYRCKNNNCTERNKSINRSVIESDFGQILAKIQPSENVLNLTRTILFDLWSKKEDQILSEVKKSELSIENLEKDIRIMTERITRAQDEKVIQVYEAKIGEFSDNIAVLKKSIRSYEIHKPNIGTALEIVFEFLKNPLKQWQNGNIHTKRLVLKLVFEQNLAYSRKDGFETAFLSLPLRVFTLPEAVESSVVLSVGIEPTS